MVAERLMAMKEPSKRIGDLFDRIADLVLMPIAIVLGIAAIVFVFWLLLP